MYCFSVIYEASWKTKSTVLETSPVPRRFMGILEINSDLNFSDILSHTSLNKPGDIQLIVYFFILLAILLDKATTPAFDAE